MHGLAKTANGPDNLELIERDEPSPGVGQVLLAVNGAGVCGTDLHIYKGEYEVRPPVVIGHEICGDVVEVGEDVDLEWKGRRVVAETYMYTCGTCAHCRTGHPNLCRDRQSIGTHVDGAFARYLVVPAANLHVVPDGLSDHAAALCEPVACVCNAVLTDRTVSAGDSVLIVGPGAIGNIAAQVARACGGHPVVRGTEKDRARLDVAESLGFEVSTIGDDLDSVIDKFDTVIECSGTAAGMTYGLQAARKGGRYVQIGLRGAPVTIPFDLICFSELRMNSGFASTPKSWLEAMRLVRGGQVDLDPLVSEIGPLSEWHRYFQASLGGDGLKYVFDPRL